MANWIRIRLGLVYFLFLAFFCLIGFRLAQLQIAPSAELDLLSRRQFERSARKSVGRLPIFDRNGEELAVTVPAVSLYARPALIRRKREVARKLTKYLGGLQEKWLAKLNSHKPFIWIQRQLSAEVSKAIAAEELPGIFAESENRRLYPGGTLAAPVLGFTDVDGKGLAGLELLLNKGLTQQTQHLAVLKDGKGIPSYIDRRQMLGTTEYTGIKTTLDRRIQNLVEEELDRTLAFTKARSVMAVVLDPQTGDVLAMGQRPSFDPNDPGESNPELYANRLVSHLFEPGSVLKTIYAAHAIEKGLLKPSTPLDCGMGQLTMGNRRIREAESNHRYGIISLDRVIQVSSNIGAVKVGQVLGPREMAAALQRFRLFSKSGIGLPGEGLGTLPPFGQWTPFFQATAAFGQGIAMTPLQMVMAYAPFANGGFAVSPRLFTTPSPPETERIITAATAETIKKILISVTEGERTTGNLARIPGIRVAGKTGTAQKYDPKMGYVSGKYYSSFIGFLPADKPELLIGVMVDEPKFPSYYSSATAVPLFQRVAERAIHILNRGPRQEMAMNDALAESEIRRGISVMQVDKTGIGKMPDLSGQTVRATLRALGSFSDQVHLEGEGYLLHQDPAPGMDITSGTPIRLSFASEPKG